MDGTAHGLVMLGSWLIYSWWWFTVVDDAWHCYTLWQSNIAGWKRWPFPRGSRKGGAYSQLYFVLFCHQSVLTENIRKQFSKRIPSLVRIDKTIIISVFVAIILHQASSTVMQSPTEMLSEPFWRWTVTRWRTHHSQGDSHSSEVEASPGSWVVAAGCAGTVAGRFGHWSFTSSRSW